MKELRAKQAVFGQLIALCDLDIEPNKMIFVQCIVPYGNSHAYQVSSQVCLKMTSYAMDKHAAFHWRYPICVPPLTGV